MGEYIKYKDEEIKIGTVENLYYVTYPKYIYALDKGWLSKLYGSDKPEVYALPDEGFRFRFPFPDEDKLPLGQIREPHNRTVAINIDNRDLPYEGVVPLAPSDTYQIEIAQQKLVHRQEDGVLCLALIYRDPLRNESFRVEDESTIRTIVGQILKNHVLQENDPEKKNFYRQMAVRLLKGYRMKAELTTEQKKVIKPLPSLKRKISKGKGRSM